MGTGYGYTDEAGLVGGMVPADEVLTISLYSQCNTILYTQNIGPFAENTETTENIEVEIPSSNSSVITGAVTDCEGAIAENSLILIESDGVPIEYIYTDEDGTFNSTVLFCESTSLASLMAIDLTNAVQSASVVLAIDSDNTVGEISACETVIEENFFTLTIDGVTKTYVASNESIQNGNGFRIYQILITDDFEVTIVIEFYGTEAGEYGGSLNALQALSDTDIGWSYFADGGLENFTVSEFNDDIVSGTFSGEIIGGGTTTILEGSFSVKPD